MTISAYTGLPGHGKSYGVVENVIVPALKAGRRVFTNIPLNADKCAELLRSTADQFDIADVIANPNWWTDVFVPGSILVIDEIWRLWPAGLSPNKIRVSDKSFLAEHRHMVGTNGASTEVVLVTQDLSQIATFARDLVEHTFRVTKLTKLGLDKRYRVDVYFGPVKGANPPASKRDREIFGTFKPEIYQLYKSHTKSQTGAAGDETRTDKRYKIFGSISIKLGFLLVVLCVFMIFYGVPRVVGFFNGDKNSAVTATTQPVPAVPGTVQSAPAVPRSMQFLSRAQSIFVSYNRGRYPDIDYQLTVVMTDSRATFTLTDLRALGYTAIAVNQCAVKITGADWMGIVMCDYHDVRDAASRTVDTASKSVTDAAGI